MRKVFSSLAEVIHTFAQRTQNEGKSSNVFFYGNKIYSYGYHYLLGEFINENTIVINDKGYSSTTRKHISQITNATRQYKQLFITDIDTRIVSQRIEQAVKSLPNARKPERYISEIKASFEDLQTYIKDYKVKLSSEDKKRFAEAKKSYDKVIKDLDQYLDKLKDQAKKTKEVNQKKLNTAVNKFLKFETNSVVGLDIKEDFLRISKDGQYVETTQQVKVTTEEAANLYRLIQAGVEIRGKRISSYTVKSLNGHLVIGCHRINVKNMHEVGSKLLTLSN